MENIFIKGLALILLFVTVTVIEFQVILNRNQLETWIPSYLTDILIILPSKNISLIDTDLFFGLTKLTFNAQHVDHD